MYTCGKCYTANALYLEGNSLVEDTTDGILAEDSCLINDMKHYAVILLFVCGYCGHQYEWKAVSKFKEFPPK